MAIKAEGIWGCTVLGGKAGETDKGSPNVQINVMIDDGPSAGQRCTYEDQVNAKSALYIGRSCKAVGWTGGSLKTLAADIDAWIKRTGGKTTVEIKHIELKKGKQYDRWVEEGCEGPPPVWDKANALGRGPQVLKPMSSERLSDADEAMRQAMAADGDTGGTPPPDDVPHAGDMDDIPFLLSASREASPIAKVLR